MDVKFINTTSSKLNSLEIIDGQIIALSDQSGMYYDLDGKRYQSAMGQILLSDSYTESAGAATDGVGASSKALADAYNAIAANLATKIQSSEGGGFASISEYWTEFNKITTNNRQIASIRFKDTGSWTPVGGWYRSIVVSQNRLGNGSYAVGGTILLFGDNVDLGELLYIGRVSGGITDTSDLSVEWITYLKTSGGKMTGTIHSSFTSGSYQGANEGGAIINSTASAGSFTMLAKMNSTNGVFTLGSYQDSLKIQYTTNDKIAENTNGVTHHMYLLNEAGNSIFPGVVQSPCFNVSAWGNGVHWACYGGRFSLVTMSDGKSLNLVYMKNSSEWTTLLAQAALNSDGSAATIQLNGNASTATRATYVGINAASNNGITSRVYTGTPTVSGPIFLQEDFTNTCVNVGIDGLGAIGVNKAKYADSAGYAPMLSFKGSNLITSTVNDTITNWGGMNTCVTFNSNTGQLTDQPSQYGLILNVSNGAQEVHQLWMTQSAGDLLHRGGNSNGWSGSWRRILDSSNYTSYCASASHTHSYLPLAGGTVSGATKIGNITLSGNTIMDTTSGITFKLSDADNGYYMSTSAFRPKEGDTGVPTLGTSGGKWKQLYASTSTISTSDRNLKENITPLSDIHKKFFMKLIPVSFTFKDGESGRTHIGFISQDVEDAMEELGMTSLDFAGFCKDVKTKTMYKEAEVKYMDGEDTIVEKIEYQVPDLDENGNIQYIYSLRYEEFIALIAHVVQDSINSIDDINRRLALHGI